MTKLKRSKSIDFTLPSAAFSAPTDFDLKRWKTYRSCPNIRLECTRDNNGRAEDAEWLNTIKSMIESWVEKMNDEMQKTELQVMCLEELQTHYSQQMDVIINNNRTLSHEIRVAMRKLKTTEINVKKEKEREKILSNQLNTIESSYNNLLSANTILFQNIEIIANKNNVDDDDEQKLLDDLYGIYQNKNKIFVKLSKECKDLTVEKTDLHNAFKSMKMSYEKELKQIMTNKATLEIGLGDLSKNHGIVVDDIKTIEENINKVQTDREIQQEERKRILENTVRVENTIRGKSQMKTIVLDKLQTILGEIVPFKI